MDKKRRDRIFDPEKYEMMFCGGCKGSGKSFHNIPGTNVCSFCGGFGLVRIQEKNRLFDELGRGSSIETAGRGDRII